MISDFLNDNGAFLFSKSGFTTKSGKKYLYETDVRKCLTSWSQSIKFATLVFSKISPHLKNETVILGVPETGSLISFLLNHVRSKATKSFQINMLRSVPKEYQPETKYTVLPLSQNQHVVVIEDDVVSGDTLIHYLLLLKNSGLSDVVVVSIIDREVITNGKTVKNRVEELGFSYHFLVGHSDIAQYGPTE